MAATTSAGGTSQSQSSMMFSCHCGSIKVAVPREPAPKYISECMCSNCRMRGCALIYYPLDDVTITKNGPTKGYLWANKMCEYTWCDSCGLMLYWYPTDAYPGKPKKIGINTRCVVNPDDLKYVERRIVWDMATTKQDGVYDEDGPLCRK